MDASGGAARKHAAGTDTGPTLRLRRAGGEAVDWVTESFLGGDAAPDATDGVPAASRPPETPISSGPHANSSVRNLPLRCAKAAAVTIGVEATGRVCLEVRVGGGMKVGHVLRELEEAERWLHASAHDAAMTPVAGLVDLSQPVRRRVVLDAGAELPLHDLTRAGVDVR
jgi:hypothetical protein